MHSSSTVQKQFWSTSNTSMSCTTDGWRSCLWISHSLAACLTYVTFLCSLHCGLSW